MGSHVDKKGRLPDAIGIGTQRCATSWLNRVLLAHPQIGKPDQGLHFFSREFDRGIGWYQEQLSPYADRRLLVEFSVSYTYHEHYQAAAKHIYDHVPEARLFMTVRNPIERAFSEYRRGVSRAEIPPRLPFQKAAQQFPYILERGLYARTIEEYRCYFSPQRILVMYFDDLEVDARAYMRRLFHYLEVDPSMETQEYGRRSASPVSPRLPILARGMYGLKNTIDRGMNSLGLSTTWRRFKRKHIYSFLWLMSLNEEDRGLSPADRQFLADFYAEDIRKLERLTERDLSSWLLAAGDPMRDSK